MMGQNAPALTIRDAVETDAAPCVDVLVASIRELCVADHENREDALAGWLANKTRESFSAWMRVPTTRIYVGEVGAVVVLVGAIDVSGEVLLNYVHPAHRFGGYSRTMVDHMERVLYAVGVRDAALTSTATAHRFYLDRGWCDAGPPTQWLGMTGFPMRKRLDR
ncbi:MAG: GNAT family N-acetyltransferase [Pseudomonadota bacterium]